ncbi:CPBP family intramembrane metalloprotease [Candidatus Thorarchaeota archaeon]|nr:MAG: CPBP family intramembrane metalloprotease [Candidatus Thorarchaeota archaeon]
MILVNAEEQYSSGQSGFLQSHPDVTYFLLVIILGSIFFTPWILESSGFIGLGISIPFILLGGLTPTFGALLAARLSHGPGGIRQLLSSFRRSGFPKIWLIVSFLLPVIIALVSVFSWILLGGAYDFTSIGLAMFIPFLIQSLIMNVWEEIGWRGFALPALQRRYSALFSAFVIGIFWSLWHWPHLAVLDSHMLDNYGNVLIFIGVTITSSIVYTWLYNSTKGNLAIPWLFHAMTNSIFPLFFYSGVSGLIAPYMLLVFTILAMALIIIYKPTTLSSSEKVLFE